MARTKGGVLTKPEIRKAVCKHPIEWDSNQFSNLDEKAVGGSVKTRLVNEASAIDLWNEGLVNIFPNNPYFYHPIYFINHLEKAGLFEFNPYEDSTDDLPTIVGEGTTCKVKSNPGFAPYTGQTKYHGYASITGHFNEWYGSYYHEGTDFAGECGKTPIRALVSGKVVLAEDQGDLHYGLSLLIKGDRQEDGKNLFYLLGHLSRYGPGIGKGSTVTPGQTVGYVGNTGNCYTAGHKVSLEERAAGKGAHLHLSVYKTNEIQSSNLWDKTNNNFRLLTR